MDVKYPFCRYDEVVRVAGMGERARESVQMLMKHASDLGGFEFRTTVARGLHTIDDIRTIAESIHGAPRYFLQNFLPRETLDPHFTGSKFTQKEMLALRDAASERVPCEIR